MADTTENVEMSDEERVVHFFNWLTGSLRTLKSVLEFMKMVIENVSKFDTGKNPDISYTQSTRNLLHSLHKKLKEVDTPIELDDDLIRALSRFKMVIDPDLRDLDSMLTLCNCMRWSLRYFVLLSFHFNSSSSTFKTVIVPELHFMNTTKDLEMNFLEQLLDPEMNFINLVCRKIDSILKVCQSLEMRLSNTNTDPDPERSDFGPLFNLCKHLIRTFKDFKSVINLEKSFLKGILLSEMRLIYSVSSDIDSILKVSQLNKARLSYINTDPDPERSNTNTDPDPEKSDFEPMFNLCEHLIRTLKETKSVINMEMRKIDLTLRPCGYRKWNLRHDNIPKELDDILQHDISEFYTFMSLTGVEDLANYDIENNPGINDDSFTPLHAACESGNLALEIWFCRSSNPESCLNVKNYRQIHLECSSGRLDFINSLLLQSIEKNEKPNISESPGNLGNQPLHVAAEHGRLDVVKHLCRHKCNVDAPNYMSWSPIHFACRSGHLDIVKHLCEEGCDKHACTSVGQQPLHVACMYGHLDIVKHLYENGCNKNKFTVLGQLPLDLACIYGHLDIVKFLYDNRKTKAAVAIPENEYQQRNNTETLDKFGYHPIHLAVLNGYIDIVKYLCQQRCDIQAVTKTGESVLDLAIQNGRDDICKLLRKEKLRRKLIKMISNMNSVCAENCDHTFCFTSAKNTYVDNNVVHNNAVNICPTFKMTDPKLNYTFCVKYIHMDANQSNMARNVECKIDKYVEVLYPERIAQYFGRINTNQEMFIFMENVEGISLHNHINKKALPHKKVVQFSKEILEGLKFLHQNKIKHMDIKPQNIMLNTEEHVKICDFGLHCYLDSDEQKNTDNSSINMKFFETLNYMAPEVLTGQKHSYPVDIWGLGASVVEMLIGVPPFDGLPFFAVIHKIGTDKSIEFDPVEPISEDMKSFVDQMLCPCPLTRATAEILLKFIDEKLSIND